MKAKADKASRVWHYMLKYQREHVEPVPPTLQEIADALGFAGRNGVFYALRTLVARGLVKVINRGSRKYVAEAEEGAEEEEDTDAAEVPEA